MVRLNGIAHENEFKSLHGWILKKIFNCRKCKIEMGLFIHPENKNEEKLVWIEHLKCEDLYYDQLK